LARATIEYEKTLAWLRTPSLLRSSLCGTGAGCSGVTPSSPSPSSSPSQPPEPHAVVLSGSHCAGISHSVVCGRHRMRSLSGRQPLEHSLDKENPSTAAGSINERNRYSLARSPLSTEPHQYSVTAACRRECCSRPDSSARLPVMEQRNMAALSFWNEYIWPSFSRTWSHDAGVRVPSWHLASHGGRLGPRGSPQRSERWITESWAITLRACSLSLA
jgi:hypothetical protein